MKKLLIISTSLLVLGSCTKNLTDLNNDPKNPKVVSSAALFTNAQKNFIDALSTPSVNTNIFRLIAQQWTETTYIDESNYDINTRSIPQGWWNALYRDVLKDLEESKKLIPTDVADAGTQKNQIAIADIMQVYAYYHLVTLFGNIPYADALDINKTFPTYQDASAVYKDLLTRLDTDIAALSASAGSFDGADIVYSGDPDAWKKFANSLKLKMGIVIADADAALAKTTVEAAAAGTFSSNDDNAKFAYLAGPPNTNPIWVNLVQSGRKDFVASNTLVDAMKALDDPRIPLFFTVDANGDYNGGLNGESNNYASFSKPAERITAADFPGVFLDYAEVELLKAEAVERGFNVGGTAKSHYDEAIIASIEDWGGTIAQANAYLANPKVNYATAAGTWKQKIGMQSWFALYNRGYDSWTSWRRLDYPTLIAPPEAVSDIPVRYTYPVNEQNTNKSNYDAAVAAMGGDDLVTVKLWFDKF